MAHLKLPSYSASSVFAHAFLTYELLPVLMWNSIIPGPKLPALDYSPCVFYPFILLISLNRAIHLP